jgi:cobalt-precorrin 5A hydrolase
MKALAIVALTPRGAKLGECIAAALGQGEVLHVAGETRLKLTELFQAGRPLVCIMALGIVVRVLGPVAGDKATDPPVVVVDEAGKFAISVLGGHQGGANELAREVAAALGGMAVITTASDTLGLPAVDLIGKSLEWKIDPQSKVTEVAAAVVRGERIAVFQDHGRRDWWQEFGEWPATFERAGERGVITPRVSARFQSAHLQDEVTVDGSAHFQDEAASDISALGGLSPPARLVITDRIFPYDNVPTILYRPPTLVAGIGCRRGTPFEAIELLFTEVCTNHGYSPLSLAQVATVTLKADEPGLIEFARRHAVSLRCFTPEQLVAVPDIPNPSETVRSKIGIPGVAEPAALLAARTSTLLVPKQKSDQVTIALARIEEP